MTCSACQSFVQKTLEKTPGVQQASVNLLLHNATIDFNADETSVEKLIEAIQSVGYEAGQTEESRYPELRLKAGVSLAAGILAMALPMHQTMHLQMLVALGILLWAGRQFYIKAWSALRHGTADMNTLIALGTGSAFVYSSATTLYPQWFLSRGLAPDIYFEAVIFILALMLAGKAIEEKAMARTVEALRKLVDLQPRTALVIRNGEEVEVAIAQLRAGDIVVVKPGERIAADGEVLAGQSGVDESMLTGESLPVDKEPGSIVMAGTLNRSGLLRYRVTRVGPQSTLAQIVKLLHDAQGSRAPIQRLADRVSLYFVPAVVAIAVVTFTVWIWAAPERAFTSAMTVLIIACPCAMGLAVPAAVMVATGRAADFGILIKGGEALEKLSMIQTLLVDKTGTITKGRPEVTGISTVPGEDESRMLRLAASVESGSEHPVARAVVEAAKSRGIAPAAVSGFQMEAGLGVYACVEEAKVVVGNRAMMERHGIEWQDLGLAHTVLYVGIEGRLAGAIAVADAIRPTTREAVEKLQEMGIEVVMLTGDNEATATDIARQAGIGTVLAGVLPAGKLEAVKKKQAQGRLVAMAGDGINDAPALAQADIGIAMGAGTDVAIASSDVTLMRNDMRSMVEAIRLSRATLRNIRQNLFWAFAYNVIGIPIAAGVLYPALEWSLNPVIASAAMAMSSVSVIGNSLRLLRFQEAHS